MSDIINDFLQMFVPIFSVLNPLGAIPVFLGLTAGYSQDKVRSISLACSITVAVGLIISSLMGSYILNFFHVSIDSFRVGGGILITLNALSMIKGKLNPSKLNQSEIDKQKDTENIGIVPLAIPLLVGPGSISATIISARTFTTLQQWCIAIVCMIIMGALVYMTLLFAKTIKKYLGNVGVNVTTRIMGVVLMAVGAEYIISGIKGSFSL